MQKSFIDHTPEQRNHAPPMSITLVTGIETGDEGKGKVGDMLQHPDVCDIGVSALGGNNAGHTVVRVIKKAVNGRKREVRKYVLSLLPAAALNDGVQVVLGRGKVIDPGALFDEMESVHKAAGTNPLDRLIIAGGAHLVFDAHKEADATLEAWREKPIGTTKNGIGPAMMTKAMRIGMRAESLYLPESKLRDEYGKLMEYFRTMFHMVINSTTEDREMDMLMKAKEFFTRGDHPIVERNMTKFWRKAINDGKRITIEGCQGSNLNIDSDRYPNVTSSTVTALGHLQGAGLPAAEVDTQVACMKAYMTSVGTGGMRTQLSPEAAHGIQQRGHEFGSRTGRPRDIGYPDLPHLANTLFQEQVSNNLRIQIAVMKLDVLDPEPEFKLCVDERANGEPEYQTFEGWQSSTAEKTIYEELPPNAQAYVNTIHTYFGEQGIDAGVRYIGTGEATDDTIDAYKTRGV